MKPIHQKIVNRNGGIDTSFTYRIDEENLGVIFNILRKQTYSDIQLAGIREISCNAHDAHVDAGKADQPIKVTLPTQLDPFLKIRDFGFGLSNEQIYTLYASMGASTKRDSNKYIGSFGIGKCSPLAYTDSFIVNSYQNGELNSWNCFIDPSNRGSVSKLFTAPTDEKDGLEVVIPVKIMDVDSFHYKASNFFGYFKVTPELVNATKSDLEKISTIKNLKPLFSGEGWKVTGNQSSIALMGNVPYTLDESVFTDDLTSDQKNIISNGLIIEFPIGDLEVAASRESLNYSDYTKKKVIDAMNRLTNELVAQGNNMLSSYKSLWDAKIFFNEAFSYEGSLYRIRSLFANSVVFNGEKVTNTLFYFNNNKNNNKDFSVNLYRAKSRRYNSVAKVRMENVEYIESGKENAVVINDLNVSNGVVNRVIQLIMGDAKKAKVFVINLNGKSFLDFNKDSKFDGPTILLSSLAKEPLSKYYGASSSSSNGGIKNAKHSSKEFVFDFSVTYSYNRSNSSYFKEVKVDLDNDSGVYLIIDKFRLVRSGNDNPSLIREIRDSLSLAGIDMPEVYCVKVANEPKVRANTKMVSFWKWLKTELENEFVKNPKLTEMIANLNLADKLDNESETSYKFASEAYKSLKLPKGELDTFLSNLREVYNSKTDGKKTAENLRGLCKFAEISTAKFNASYDIIADMKKIKNKYLIFFVLAKECGGYHEVKAVDTKAINDYVNLVDGV